MNRLLLLFFLITISPGAFSQVFQPVDDGSTIRFKIKNLGFNVTGSLSGVKGTINFDPKNLAACNFDVTVEVSTINTGIDGRDKHLRSDDYFDVKKYPHIHFISTKVTPSTKNGTLFIIGKLTIKETTKEVAFPFTATPQDGNYRFKGGFKINRKDFKVGGGSTISDNLTIILDVLAKKG